jgi:hypothetical protein
MLNRMNPFGASAPQLQTLLPGSVTNATEYTLKLLVDDTTNDIYVISKVVNNPIDPAELMRLQRTAHVQKVFANNKKIDGGITNFVNIGFDNAVGDIPGPAAGPAAAPAPAPVAAPAAAPAPAPVTEADITALLTTVRGLVNATADADYNALVDADPVNNAIIDVVKAGAHPAATKADALQKLDNAIAEVAGVAIVAGDTVEGKAIDLVTNAAIVAPVPAPAPAPAAPAAPAALITEDEIRDLLTLVEVEVQGTADEAAFNALNGNIIDAVKAGTHPAATKDEAIQKLANAIAAVAGVHIDPADTAEGKAIALVTAADVVAAAPGMPGGNQYVYGKQKAYPKNVTFSKKTTHKQTHNKTVRRLQNIINNAL